jgi:hypothetical protein
VCGLRVNNNSVLCPPNSQARSQSFSLYARKFDEAVDILVKAKPQKKSDKEIDATKMPMRTIKTIAEAFGDLVVAKKSTLAKN